MLELNDTVLEVVSGGWGSSKKITINKNVMVISANNNEVEKGGTIIFSISQFNGTQKN